MAGRLLGTRTSGLTVRRLYIDLLRCRCVRLNYIAETVHPFDTKTFDLSKETAVADMLRWAASLEGA